MQTVREKMREREKTEQEGAIRFDFARASQPCWAPDVLQLAVFS